MGDRRTSAPPVADSPKNPSVGVSGSSLPAFLRCYRWPRSGFGFQALFANSATAMVVNFKHKQVTACPRGFSLVEVAVALIIISLLVGGILKGWEMIQRSRVRTFVVTTTSVQSAYFAFLDRYGHVAGDWNPVDASRALGETVNGGGNDNGRLDTTPADPWTESNGFWEQLAKGGFVRGLFQGTPATEPTLSNDLVPLNLYDQPIIVGRTSDYEGVSPLRRHIVVGRGVPVGMLRELDVKLDDGKPHQGKVRATLDDGGITVFGGTNFWGGRESACVDAGPDWDVSAGAQDCNAVLLF